MCIVLTWQAGSHRRNRRNRCKLWAHWQAGGVRASVSVATAWSVACRCIDSAGAAVTSVASVASVSVDSAGAGIPRARAHSTNAAAAAKWPRVGCATHLVGANLPPAGEARWAANLLIDLDQPHARYQTELPPHALHVAPRAVHHHQRNAPRLCLHPRAQLRRRPRTCKCNQRNRRNQRDQRDRRDRRDRRNRRSRRDSRKPHLPD